MAIEGVGRDGGPRVAQDALVPAAHKTNQAATSRRILGSYSEAEKEKMKSEGERRLTGGEKWGVDRR